MRALTRSAGQALYAGKAGRAVLACTRYDTLTAATHCALLQRIAALKQHRCAL